MSQVRYVNRLVGTVDRFQMHWNSADTCLLEEHLNAYEHVAYDEKPMMRYLCDARAGGGPWETITESQARDDIAAGDKQVDAIGASILPTDSDERKEIPIFSGVLNYFPLAIAAVARLSKRGNDKHNPGRPLHWSRDKSTDHEDCIARHLIDVDTPNADGEYEDATALAWRALAKLQCLEEKRLGKPMSRGSK